MKNKTRLLAVITGICMMSSIACVAKAASSVKTDVNFDNYTADTEIRDANGDVTDIVLNQATGSNGYRINEVSVAVSDWLSKNHLVGIKDLSATDSEHKNVVTARMDPNGTRRNSELRFGLLEVNGHTVDLSSNTASVEFEMKIPDRSLITCMYIEPFAYNSAIGSVQLEVNPGGINSSTYVHTTANTQYAQIFAPDTKNTKFNIRTDGKILGGAEDTNNGYAHSDAYTQGDWAKVRIDLSYTNGSYTAAAYIDDKYVGSQTNVYGDQKTPILRGVRFAVASPAIVKGYTDLVYIDNFKITASPAEEPPATFTAEKITESTDESGDPAAGYIASVDSFRGTLKMVKWTVTSTDDKDDPIETSKSFEDGVEISGDSTLRFGLIVSGTEAQLEKIASVVMTIE